MVLYLSFKVASLSFMITSFYTAKSTLSLCHDYFMLLTTCAYKRLRCNENSQNNTATMGSKHSTKRQDSIAHHVYETAHRIGSALSKPRDDPGALWDKEIQPLDTFLLIWLDTNVERNDQIQTTIKFLQKVVKGTLLMTDCDIFKKQLKEYEADEKIVLVVSAGFGKKIMPDIHNFTSIIAIYVYSLDYSIDDKWIQDYWKVRGIFSNITELARQLLRDLTYIKRMEDSNNQDILRQPSVDDHSICQTNQNAIQAGL